LKKPGLEGDVHRLEVVGTVRGAELLYGVWGEMEMDDEGEVDDMAEKLVRWPGVVRSEMMGMGVAGICRGVRGMNQPWVVER
jgi:hypothetical protein